MDNQKGNGNLWKYAGLAFSFAFTLAAGMYLGFLVGQFLDRRLGTTPWLMLAGTFLGVAAAFRGLIRELMRGFKDPGGKGNGAGGGCR